MPSTLRKVTLWLRRDQIEALDEAARNDGDGNRSSVARQVVDLGLQQLRRVSGSQSEGAQS